MCVVAQRRAVSYVKTYSFGANGAATLVGSMPRTRNYSQPAPSPARQAARRATRRFTARTVVLPVAAVLMAVLLAMLSFVYLDMHAQVTGAAKQNDSLLRELSRVNEANALMEIKLETANDPSRIHAIAVNRLGMYQPTNDQIIRIDRVAPAARGSQTYSPVRSESTGFLALIRQVFGW